MPDHYTIAANCDQVPSVDDWTKRVSEALSEEVLKLRQHALGCLAQNVKDQRWGVLAGIASKILTDRGVQYQ
jgi:hypothetical protein